MSKEEFYQQVCGKVYLTKTFFISDQNNGQLVLIKNIMSISGTFLVFTSFQIVCIFGLSPSPEERLPGEEAGGADVSVLRMIYGAH